MRRFLAPLAVSLIAGVLLWLLYTKPSHHAPAPASKPLPAAAPRLPATSVETQVPWQSAGQEATLATTLRTYLNRTHVRRDEAVLTFVDAGAHQRFLTRTPAAGVSVIGQINALHTIRIHVNDYDAFARELAAHGSDYIKVSGNLIFTPPTPPAVEARTVGYTAPVGHHLLNLLGLEPADSSRGRGVTIAILDGGASPGAAFGNRLSYLDIGYGITGYGDDGAHATSVAALAGSGALDAPGVASAANLLSIKVTGTDGLADSFSLAVGVLAALDSGAQVINLSLGAYGDSPVLAEAIERAVVAGVAVVAAAGNDQAGQLAWPAAYPGVISVGATDAAGQQALFSNSGVGLQLTAPGYGIATVGPNDTRVAFSGTSASAPIVAGSIATLLAASPELTPLAAADLLAAYGNDGGSAGPDRDYGRATVNPGWALDRDNPNRIDAAITSFSYNPAEKAISVVVQNRGYQPLSDLILTIAIGNTASRHTLPLLAPTASSTTTVVIPAGTASVNGQTILVLDLKTPAGLIDQDMSNNRRAAMLALSLEE